MFYPPLKSLWYKQTLFLGMLLGNFAGLLLLCSGNPISRRFLESAFPYTAFGYYTSDLLNLLGLVFGFLIFPAILTCVSKRFYALWGLVPIVLLLLWIVVGSLIAHTFSSFFDPFWIFPVVALLCWGIASVPISMFRFLRHHHRKHGPSTVSPDRTKSLVRWIGTPTSITPLLALIILGWYNIKHPLRISVTVKPRFLLGKETRVPLLKKGSQLYVKAFLNGQEQLCEIDTGSDSVEYSRGLQIRGRLTSRRGQSCDVLGACVDSQTIVLPHVKIGSYEVTNLPTEMLDSGTGLFSPPQRTDVDKETLLGNPAFVMTVLTIDYKNAEMVIRPPLYDFTKQRRKVGDRVLQMGWTTNSSGEDWESELYGCPDVRVALAGASFWCTVDTGWSSSELGLTDNFVKVHPSIRQVKRDMALFNGTHSSAQLERLHDLNLTIPCLWPPHAKPLSLKVNGFVTPTLDGDDKQGEGVIGLALMKRYRITIDYGRRRVLLEPYAQDTPGQKQEKMPQKAKQTGI